MELKLATFIVVVTNAGFFAFFGMVFYGCVKKKVYALGRWYYLDREKSEFWQVVVGYILLAGVLGFFRLFVFPDKLFPYI